MVNVEIDMSANILMTAQPFALKLSDSRPVGHHAMSRLGAIATTIAEQRELQITMPRLSDPLEKHEALMRALIKRWTAISNRFLEIADQHDGCIDDGVIQVTVPLGLVRAAAAFALDQTEQN